MTYNALMGTLNPTHSLTHSLTRPMINLTPGIHKDSAWENRKGWGMAYSINHSDHRKLSWLNKSMCILVYVHLWRQQWMS